MGNEISGEISAKRNGLQLLTQRALNVMHRILTAVKMMHRTWFFCFFLLFAWLIFVSEDGGSIFLRNVIKFPQGYMLSHSRR
jgi:hypothetical protein